MVVGDAAAIAAGFLGILKWCLLKTAMFKGFGRSKKKRFLRKMN
jgi:hypothetical protein